MTPKLSDWTPDPGDPILHLPTGKTLTLTRILRMNGQTYFICRKQDPHAGPPHAMLLAEDCTQPRPKSRPKPKLPAPTPDPEEP